MCQLMNRTHQGKGLISNVVNKLIDLTPFEAHIPFYHWCGPGTNVSKRLKNEDLGINELDYHCRNHDLEYEKHKNSNERSAADAILEKKSREIYQSKNKGFYERASAFAVNKAMQAKRIIGSGSKQSQNRKKGKGLYLQPYKMNGNGMYISPASYNIKKSAKKSKKRKNNKRIKGGVIPILPLLAGISALGSITGGISSIAKVASDNRHNKKTLLELKRHNLAMEGKGLKQPKRKSNKKKKCQNL